MTTTSRTTTTDSAWAPLAVPLFRSLWIASLVSNIGSWMESVGAQWFLVESAAPAVVIALVQTASLAPTALFSLPAGVLADSVDRRRLLLGTTVASALVSTALAVSALAGVLSPPMLLTFTSLLGVAGALVGPAWQAIQPDLVPREQIRAAAGLGGISVNASRAIGPAVAGALLAVSGPWLVFLLDALSFAAVVVALWRWRPERRRAVDPERFVESLVAGLRYVAAAGLIRRLLLRSALFALPASALWALLPLVATRLGFSSLGYGVLLGAIGLGATGSIALLPLARRYASDSRLIGVAALVFGLGTVVAAVAPAWLVLASLVLTGAAWTLSLTVINSAMQLTLATWVRARGLAVYVLVFMGCNAAGSALFGALSDLIGLAGALEVAAALLLAVALSTIALPLLPGTSEIDRSVSLAWSVPALQMEPAPEDGPITVVLEYTVTPVNADQFVAATRLLRLSRMRGGARRWRLYRDAKASDRYIEIFDVSSWFEYRHQHLERLTGEDRRTLDAVLALASTASEEDQLLPAGHRRVT